jgi:hypothetical protein
MEAMKKAFSVVTIAALCALAPAPPIQAADAPATPAPASHTGTPPPTIYHVVTRPLCAELHKHIAPTIGMLLQNDQTMKSSPKLFADYNRDNLYGVNNDASNGNGAMSGPNTSAGESSNGTMNDAQSMTILKMENMVSPIANNIIAMQKMLDSPALLASTGNPDDDKRIADIRAKLLKAIADQSATLDIINGFVTTQQMGDLQHAGEEYISSINQSDQTQTSNTGVASPNPLLQDPNAAGLPANPYDVQLAAIPGLTLGYNPTTRLLQAVNWTIEQTRNNENEASVAVMGAAQSCGLGPAPAPQASP